MFARGASPLSIAAFTGDIGLARIDITPPLGINHRNWGAAVHDLAIGVHRPLTATALAISAEPQAEPLILIAVDLGWWKSREDEWHVRGGVIEALGLHPSRVILALSHTHAGPNLYHRDGDKPGGELIAPYLDTLRDRLIKAARTALANRMPARLTWRYGRCDLAQNRDLREPGRERYVVGWNPTEAADDTLLVGRVETQDTGRTLATVVNYACHPTTLAFENRWLSPDFPGAMRELVENATHAPCLFLQGASGELGPAAQHDSQPATADRLGRRLGHAALAVLEAWPDTARTLDRIVESGAPVVTTLPAGGPDCTDLRAEVCAVDLPLKPLSSVSALEAELAACSDRAQRERLWRRLAVRHMVGDGSSTAMPLWLWRCGEALLVAQPNEAYSALQTHLRAQLAPRPVIVLNVANGYAGYLPPRDLYSRDQYAAWQTPFAAGALERLIGVSAQRLGRLLRSD